MTTKGVCFGRKVLRPLVMMFLCIGFLISCADQEENKFITVYPNPAISHCVVRALNSAQGIASVEVIDGMNQTLVSAQPSSSPIFTTLALSDITPGRYRVRCTLADGSVHWADLIKQ